MAPTRPLRSRSKTADILLQLAEVADAAFDAIVHARAAARYGSDYRRVLAAKVKKEAHRNILRLKQKKLIEECYLGEELRYALTNEGLIEACRISVLRAKTFRNRRKMTFVVYDVPETQKLHRRILQRFLSSAGFVRLQKSVWISQQDAEKEIERLLLVTGLRKWVRVFSATERLRPKK